MKKRAAFKRANKRKRIKNTAKYRLLNNQKTTRPTRDGQEKTPSKTTFNQG